MLQPILKDRQAAENAWACFHCATVPNLGGTQAIEFDRLWALPKSTQATRLEAARSLSFSASGLSAAPARQHSSRRQDGHDVTAVTTIDVEIAV